MLGGSFRTLHFAVRPLILARYTGQILLVLSVLTLVPACVALLDGRSDIGLRYAGVIATFAILGFAGARLRTDERIQPNEAMVVSALVFLIPGLAMAVPLCGYGIAPLDAVFEAVSGVTTTGLSTLGTLEGRPRSLLFARAWLQWLGGLGVVVLALAFMIPSGIAAKRLGFDENEAADYVGGTRSHARRILIVYLLLTLGAVALCLAAGFGGFEALVHALAAVSTGGFAPVDASLAAFDGGQRTVVLVACIAGAISFSLYYTASLRAALRDSRLWTLLVLIALATLALGLLEGARRPDAATWGHAFWMAVSAQTTAGFSTLPPSELGAGAKLVLIGSMGVGGEVGSTAGGLKTLRLLILAQLLVVHVLRMSMPASSPLVPRLGGKRIGSDEIETAAALALSYLGVILLSWLAFLAYGHPPLDSLFDVVSALGTVGLSAGATGPGLEPLLKGVLCLDMLLGRVELFAFFVLVFPGTWIGRRRSTR